MVHNMNSGGWVGLLVVTLGLGSTSCVATAGPARGSDPVSASLAATGASSFEGNGGPSDAHFIEADDFFVSAKPFVSGWIYVHLAKMRQAPSNQTKNEGRFSKVYDGAELWSPHFWRTRTVVPADLVVGNQVICFDSNKQGDVYRAPRDRDNARRGSWWLTRIDDVSDMFKGIVTVAGSYHCASEALRAVVQ
jgi:hypothetical protein